MTADGSRKLFQAGPWLIAFSGTQLTKNAVETSVGEIAEAPDVHGLVRVLRSAMTALGLPLGRGEEIDFRACLLVGRSGDGLYSIGVDLAWIRLDAGRPFGHGGGGTYAEAGAWEALRGGHPPGDAVRRGVEAAIAYSGTCGGEIQSAATPAPRRARRR